MSDFFLTPLLIDLAIVLIAVFIIWRSARRGFVRTVIELVGYILAAMISFSLAGIIAQSVYDKSIRPEIIETVEQNISEGANLSEIQTAMQDVMDELPGFITLFSGSNGLSADALSQEMDDTISGGVHTAAVSVADQIVQPIAVSGIKAILGSILFTVLMIGVRFISRTLNRLINFSFLRPINKLLGGLVGVLKAVLILFCAVTIIALLRTYISGADEIFSPQVIDKTYLFKLLYNANPFI